ncbi:MAG: arsenate reductase ArsC [Bacteroidetes bacterium]|nr:arsenate reductase ArsC [Bacteroidota bacterium]
MKKNLLFVCVENSNRSQMAQAFAIIHGEDMVNAFSAGSAPLGKINSRAIEVMREIGYDLSAHSSKSLALIPDITFDHVVTMGCGDACPHVKAIQSLDWQIPDPRNMDMEGFREVRSLIEEKVKELLLEDY